eukprot:SAG31_NODE_1389_length_8545_cov_3.081103_8_plen_138_part_00
MVRRADELVPGRRKVKRQISLEHKGARFPKNASSHLSLGRTRPLPSLRAQLHGEQTSIALRITMMMLTGTQVLRLIAIGLQSQAGPQQAGPQQASRIMCLGDSITLGVGGGGYREPLGNLLQVCTSKSTSKLLRFSS